MSFAEAIRKGLDAHERAVRARAEVDSVLRSASEEISEVLGFRLSLEFGTSIKEGVRSAVASFATLEAPKIRVDILNSVAPGGRRQLAEVRFSELVYPVTLSWDDRSEFATNREEFTAALEKLLESRKTGDKISEIAPKAPALEPPPEN